MKRLQIIIVFLILGCYFNALTFASTPSELELNQAEKYVIEHVEKGEIADLQKQFPKKNRILSAYFLKKLLTGGFLDLEVTEEGISIVKAQIKEKLDISKEKISFPVYLVPERKVAILLVTGAADAQSLNYYRSK